MTNGNTSTVVFATRTSPVHRPSRSQRPGIVLGLRYERRFKGELEKLFKSNPSLRVEYNPWFFYRRADGQAGACCPDILLHDDEVGITWVIEVKYTWVSEAIAKLRDLYCPVVELALSRKTEPLVVVKRLTPESPMPRMGLLLSSNSKLYQWTDMGPITL
jgi:hypothetical protein